VWAKNLAVNGDIEIDRIEIFPTLAPVNLTSLTISYKDDWESFDLNTGGMTLLRSMLSQLTVVRHGWAAYIVKNPLWVTWPTHQPGAG